MSANEMPERIWAAPWHSRSDADAGVWQSNDPGNEVYALEYLRKDLCASVPVRGLLQRAVDLIDGDLIGRDWKRACRSFVADAKAALMPAPQPEAATQTAQEAVLREIIEWAHTQRGSYPNWIDRARQAVGDFEGDAGHPPQPSETVAVRPLEWKDAAPFFDDEPGSVIYSEAVGAGYTYVAESAECTLEESKAACQAAFERRILAALTPTPTDNTTLVDEMENLRDRNGKPPLTKEEMARFRELFPLDYLSRVALAAWVNVRPDQLPKEMQAHNCPATMEAWGRAAEAIRAALASREAPPVDQQEAVVEEMGGGDVIALVDPSDWEVEPQLAYARGWNAALRALKGPDNG